MWNDECGMRNSAKQRQASPLIPNSEFSIPN